jgi:hypothetical protein
MSELNFRNFDESIGKPSNPGKFLEAISKAIKLDTFERDAPKGYHRANNPLLKNFKEGFSLDGEYNRLVKEERKRGIDAKMELLDIINKVQRKKAKGTHITGKMLTQQKEKILEKGTQRNKKSVMNQINNYRIKDNSEMIKHLLMTTKIRAYMKRQLQKSYMIVDFMRKHPEKIHYDKEVILCIDCHGADLPRKIIQVKESENVRVFGAKESGKLTSGGIGYVHGDKYIDKGINFTGMMKHAVIDDSFNFINRPMRSRERFLEYYIKTKVSHSPDYFNSGIDNVTNKRMFFKTLTNDFGNFRPYMDHKYFLKDEPIDLTNNSKIDLENFFDSSTFFNKFSVLYSNINNDSKHTIQTNINDCDFIESSYWNEKLNITTYGEDVKYILLSDIITAFKKNGYKHIYILDFSCRDIPYVISKEFRDAIHHLQKLNDSYSESKKITMGQVINSTAIEKGSIRTVPIDPYSFIVSNEIAVNKINLKGGTGQYLDDSHLTYLYIDYLREDPFIAILKDLFIYDYNQKKIEGLNSIYQNLISNFSLNEKEKEHFEYWLISFYIFIMIGYLTPLFESNGDILILKGGKSFQLLADGTYPSEDIDVKILDSLQNKKNIAKVLADVLIHFIEDIYSTIKAKCPVSILDPDSSRQVNQNIYKLSYKYVKNSSSHPHFRAILDIDFKETDYGNDIERKLMDILTGVSPVVKQIPIVSFEHYTTFVYNVYPISTQLLEKDVLVSENGSQREELFKTYGEDIVNDIVISLKQFNTRGYITDEMNNTVNALASKYKLKPEEIYFINDKISEIEFYINKFSKPIEWLKQKYGEITLNNNIHIIANVERAKQKKLKQQRENEISRRNEMTDMSRHNEEAKQQRNKFLKEEAERSRIAQEEELARMAEQARKSQRKSEKKSRMTELKQMERENKNSQTYRQLYSQMLRNKIHKTKKKSKHNSPEPMSQRNLDMMRKLQLGTPGLRLTNRIKYFTRWLKGE